MTAKPYNGVGRMSVTNEVLFCMLKYSSYNISYQTNV